MGPSPNVGDASRRCQLAEVPRRSVRRNSRSRRQRPVGGHSRTSRWTGRATSRVLRDSAEYRMALEELDGTAVASSSGI